MMAQIAPDTVVEYDDAGSGPPVVLLHAFPLSRAMWRPQVEALRQNYHVLTPDLRGFGGTSPFRGSPSIDRKADDVAGLLDALKLTGPVVVGGLSMGGYVALAFARRHTQRLRALVLADTRAEPDDEEGRANRNRLIAFSHSHSARDVLDATLPKMVSAATRT